LAVPADRWRLSVAPMMDCPDTKKKTQSDQRVT
jgi:hypothetical protein